MSHKTKEEKYSWNVPGTTLLSCMKWCCENNTSAFLQTNIGWTFYNWILLDRFGSINELPKNISLNCVNLSSNNWIISIDKGKTWFAPYTEIADENK